GLAALSSLTASIGIGALALSRGSSPWFAFAVAAALAGFLLWNWHPARLFLGDNGAYVVALFLVYGIEQASSTVGALLLGAGLLGVFLVDMAATLLRRRLSSQPLFSRDRLHLYDRLADRGTPIPLIALWSGALQLGLGLLAVLADRFFPPPLASVVVLLTGAGVVLWLVRALGATQPGYWAGQ
ncbi:MAG: hypothetical protein LC739_14265, partial [Actinobacteria bacterium]|nr:hypothetical protein [Actinomycetota bacterium]